MRLHKVSRVTKNYTQLRDRARKVKITLSGAARALGVRRQHLSYVIHGHRQSRRLISDFTRMVEAAEARARK